MPPEAKNSFTYDELIKCAKGQMFGPGNPQLPLPPMLMCDRITKIDSDGGTFEKGQIDGSMIYGNADEYRNFLFGSLFYLHQWYAIKDNESYVKIQPFIEKMIDRMYSTKYKRLQ